MLPVNAVKCSKKATLASLAAVHAEMADKQKRVSNVIISGLLPSAGGISDAEIFANLCEEHLSGITFFAGIDLNVGVEEYVFIFAPA